MKFLNEFIFDKEADAKKFIKDMSDLYYNKGYLSTVMYVKHIMVMM